MGKRWLVGLARVAVALGMGCCMFLAGKQGVAEWYFRSGRPQSIERAMQIDPSNAKYPAGLGELEHLYSDSAQPEQIVTLFEKATKRSPQNAEYWSELAEAYDWAGRANDAQKSFERARELFPRSPEIKWKLANFYVRSGQDAQALGILHELLVRDEAPREQIFLLATRATPDAGKIADEVLPADAKVALDFVNFEVRRGEADGAERAWARLLALKQPFAIDETFPFLDFLIHRRKAEALSDAWASLASRFPEKASGRPSPPNLVWNGNFESEILNGGLDWRVIDTASVTVSSGAADTTDGSHALRIDFDGTTNVDYGGVLQYIPVRGGSEYEFTGYMRANGITTESGPRFQVFDAYDMNRLFATCGGMTGTTGWSKCRLDFKTPAQTQLVILRVARPVSEKFDNEIAGTVWIERMSLVEMATRAKRRDRE